MNLPPIEGSVIAQQFAVEELAGRGGMGAVYRARDLTTSALVALKLLQPHVESAQQIERFHREAQLLSQLKHPGIVAYLSHGLTEDGRPYLVLEWLTGQDLGARLTAGALPIKDCLHIIAQVAGALAIAHDRGIVHRDIKPGNIFLRDRRIDQAMLLDFGIARWQQATSITHTGNLLGTPGYMAPEQARGDRQLGPQTDIYALGCVLFECLTGRPAFSGEHLVGVLAKVLFETVRPVLSLRPNVPAPLAELLERMLNKDPAQRPPDAAGLCRELARITLCALDDEPLPIAIAAAAAATPTPLRDAMQLLSVVLAAPPELLRSTASKPPIKESPRPAFADALFTQLSRLGGSGEWLADGSLAVVVPPAVSAVDQASTAARCALLIKDQWPTAWVAMAMGRGQLRDKLAIGEVIDRTASLLRKRAGLSAASESSPVSTSLHGIWLDELSTRLLEPRFSINTQQGQAALTSEQPRSDASRLLLGRPTPCVGREQDLAMLFAALDRCIENSAACAVLVSAPPGVGKSRLKHEFLRCVSARGLSVLTLSGRSAQLSAGSPYGLLRDAFQRLCGLDEGGSPELLAAHFDRRIGAHVSLEDAQRIEEFLAALCGLPIAEPSILLRAALSDPKIMSEQIQRAFIDFLRAETQALPCLLILEDLHWGDAATVKLIDAALLELRERPLFVLAFARPEVTDQFPKLWERRPLQHIRLAGISKRAAERLVKAVLGDQVTPATTARIVEQAQGNALFLEELIRATADGKLDAQPETVLAMLQARLSCLPARPRRVLCGASVFGQRFWRGGVRALLGQAGDTPGLRACLDELVSVEIIEQQRTSCFPEETEYCFRHALLRDAAYGLLIEEDRALSHRLAGAYLERIGERDPLVLAEHAYFAGDFERALLHSLHAAEQSYDRDDHEGVLVRVERAIACGASGELLGRLHSLQLEVCIWRQGWQAGLQMGKEALALLPRGGLPWSRVMGSLALITPNLGAMDEFAAVVEALTSCEPNPDAVAAYCAAAGMTLGLLTMMGDYSRARGLLANLDRVASSISKDEPLAHAHMDQGRCAFGYFLGDDPWATYQAGMRTEAAFERAQASRWHWAMKMLRAVAQAALGDWDEAERTLRAYAEHVQKHIDAWSLTYSRLYLMRLLVERDADPGRLEEAAGLARQLIEQGGSEGVVGPAHGALARVFLLSGRLAEALAESEKALARAHNFRCWRPLMYRTRIEIHLRQGNAIAARQVAQEGLRCIASLGGSTGHSEVPLGIAIAEAHAAAAELDSARTALAQTLQIIDTRAEKIPDPIARSRFLTQIPQHVRARELRIAWRI